MIGKVTIKGFDNMRNEVNSMNKGGYDYVGHTKLCEHCMKTNLYFMKDATDEEKKLIEKLLER